MHEVLIKVVLGRQHLRSENVEYLGIIHLRAQQNWKALEAPTTSNQ